MSSGSPMHRQAWELIPWVVNGTVTARERASVEAHLAECEECREELLFQRRVRGAVLTQPSVEAEEDGWQRLHARLQAEDSSDQFDSQDLVATSARRRVLGGWAFGWVAVMVLQALAIGALGMALWSRTHTPAWSAVYRTLSSSETAPAAATIRIVLEPRTTIGELQGLLQRNDLQIVGGPSAEGVWSLAPSGASSAAATRAALRSLRADPFVRFAEPLDAGP